MDRGDAIDDGGWYSPLGVPYHDEFRVALPAGTGDGPGGGDKEKLVWVDVWAATADAPVTGQFVNSPDVRFLCVSERGHTGDSTDGFEQHLHRNGPRHIPSANSSSSNRCKLASVIPSFKQSQGSRRSRKNQARRSAKKRRKQHDLLIPISPSFLHQAFQGLVDNHYTFVDGGDISNPRINPKATTFKPTRILSIRDNDLKVISSHIQNPNQGLIYRFGTSSSDIVLVPRRYALEQIQVKSNDHISLCKAFDHVESHVKKSEQRGTKSKFVVTEEYNKYVCIGNQTCRGSVGIRRYHKALLACQEEELDRIMRYFKAVEHLFEMFMDTEEIRIVHDAVENMRSETFSVPTSSTKTKAASIYGAFACGKNVYLAAHTDQDYTYSSISVHSPNKSYSLDDDIIAYFAFPRLGIAIPLRPGDVLFFNPNEPHCVSSRAKNEHDIYCVSLYLKSSNIGLNNNGQSLSKHEDVILDYYKSLM